MNPSVLLSKKIKPHISGWLSFGDQWVCLRLLENSYTFPVIGPCVCPDVRGWRNGRKLHPLVWNSRVGDCGSHLSDPKERENSLSSFSLLFLASPFPVGKLIKPRPWNLRSGWRYKILGILFILRSEVEKELSYPFSVIFWNAHLLAQRFHCWWESSVRRRWEGPLLNWQSWLF